MSISENQGSFVVSGGAQISLSQMFAVSASASNPTYLVLSGLDRNEYTKAGTGATGTLNGNGAKATFSSGGSDFRNVGLVFTYNAATGRYYNSTYGYLDQLTYTASASVNDITSLSLFGTNDLSYAQGWASSPISMADSGTFTFYGSATIATQPTFSGSVPAQATPDSIASVAAKFVGDVWNMNGCWVLASTIAADAGASLPVTSTSVGTPGAPSGEWQVAFNGPAGQSGNWQSMVTEGDIVVIGNAQGLGHVTTCVSGTGASAMLIDNADFGTNLAHDGDSNDLIIEGPHLASQEWSAATANDVVIYRLDTPVISESVSSATMLTGASLSLSGIFSAADPFNAAVTEYQVYDTASADWLTAGGTAVAAHTAGTADTVSSLSGVCLVGGASTGADTVEVRAYNGSYWGDWEALAVTVQAGTAPVLAVPTATQTWVQGKKISFALPGGTFVDPQKAKLTYSAVLGSGGALPSWLSFNAANQTFSGTVPNVMQTLALTVTATDTSGLSASETFQAVVPAAAPTLLHQTAAQTWTEGQPISFALAGNTFADPQGEALSDVATLASGLALPSWLTFNSATATFSGTVGYTSGPVSIKVLATDSSGLSVSETFQATLVAPPPVLANQTAGQSWTAGAAQSLPLAANTFASVPNQTLKYTSKLPSGLTINGSTGTISGTVPFATGSYAITVTATETSGLSAAETFQAVVTASAPVLANQTPAQTWTANRAVSFTLPSNTFLDPQGEKLTYVASGLPAGLTMNATTGKISGSAPASVSGATVKVTATDQSGLSASESFQVAVTAAAPSAMNLIAPQTWTANKLVSFKPASNVFADPQGEALTYSATLADGSALPSWLSFNAASGTFSGTAPATLGTLALKVKAVDASFLSASQTFSATVQASAPTVAHPTAALTWTAG